MAVDDAYVFPGFLTPVLTQLFFPKPPTTFLTCFCRGERRKYAGKKSHLNRGSNSQPPGHESDTLTTEPPGRGGGGDQTYDLSCRLFKQTESAFFTDSLSLPFLQSPTYFQTTTLPSSSTSRMILRISASGIFCPWILNACESSEADIVPLPSLSNS